MKDVEERIAHIVNDREHGSRWLVRETMLLLHDVASDTSVAADEAMQQVRFAGQQLAGARPAMAALAGAVQRILNVPGGVVGIVQEARRLLEDYDTTTERIATFARPLLKGTLLTHSLSGTVLDVLVACKAALEQVIVLEGRPLYEGRAMAQALAKQGIAVTLITDAQADIFLPRCSAVVVGADTILANGDVLNKAGTALLAWAAKGHQVAFYVLSETLKISPHPWSGNETQLEEKEADEVVDAPMPGITVRNFYFDHTPALLVTKIVTEQGVLGPLEVQRLAETLHF